MFTKTIVFAALTLSTLSAVASANEIGSVPERPAAREAIEIHVMEKKKNKPQLMQLAFPCRDGWILSPNPTQLGCIPNTLAVAPKPGN